MTLYIHKYEPKYSLSKIYEQYGTVLIDYNHKNLIKAKLR